MTRTTEAQRNMARAIDLAQRAGTPGDEAIVLEELTDAIEGLEARGLSNRDVTFTDEVVRSAQAAGAEFSPGAIEVLDLLKDRKALPDPQELAYARAAEVLSAPSELTKPLVEQALEELPPTGKGRELANKVLQERLQEGSVTKDAAQALRAFVMQPPVQLDFSPVLTARQRGIRESFAALLQEKIGHAPRVGSWGKMINQGEIDSFVEHLDGKLNSDDAALLRAICDDFHATLKKHHVKLNGGREVWIRFVADTLGNNLPEILAIDETTRQGLIQRLNGMNRGAVSTNRVNAPGFHWAAPRQRFREMLEDPSAHFRWRLGEESDPAGRTYDLVMQPEDIVEAAMHGSAGKFVKHYVARQSKATDELEALWSDSWLNMAEAARLDVNRALAPPSPRELLTYLSEVAPSRLSEIAGRAFSDLGEGEPETRMFGSHTIVLTPTRELKLSEPRALPNGNYAVDVELVERRTKMVGRDIIMGPAFANQKVVETRTVEMTPFGFFVEP